MNPATESWEDDRNHTSAPTVPVAEHDFLAARSIKRELLDELQELYGVEANPAEELLRRWPNDPAGDPDVAGLLFEDFRQRSLRGEALSRSKYEGQFPEHRDSLASLFRRQDFLRSVTAVSEPGAPTLALPQIGDDLFGFRLHHQLGQGAFARVFLAEQSELAGRAVVLKTSDRTGTEPQTLAQLQHTHIVPIYSVHEDVPAGLRAVCMPYFGGASLSEVLKAIWEQTDRPTRGWQLVAALAQVGGPDLQSMLRGCEAQRGIGFQPVESAGKHDRLEAYPTKKTPDPLAPGGPLAELERLDYVQACVWIVARLAEGLQHAHDRGVLHRDIKPSNILVGADGTPMLLDFNLAHDENQSQAQVEATLGGTVAYMAPEHLRALNGRSLELIQRVDHRADVYGLGMVLFEMITGHHAFDQQASYSPMPILIEAMAAERSRALPSLREFRTDAPWGLESIVRKCLQPDPDQRYQRADELAEDLNRLLGDRPLKHAPELSRSEQVHKWIRRHPRLASSGAVAAVSVALLAAGAALLAGTRARLDAAQNRVFEAEGAEAQQRKHEFERGTLQALCLVNTYSELPQHADQGRAVCEQTLSFYNILENSDWQQHPAWRRLSSAEQQRLAEDARELLLLLAGACVRLATNGDTAVHDATSASAGSAAPEVVLRDALALLERADAIQDLPPSAAVWQAKAAYLRQLGDDTAASAADHHAASVRPASARDYYLLATAHLQNGGSAVRSPHARAIQELEQAVRLDPRHYWSWMQKGLCHLELGEHHQALADFSVCVGLWPEFAWGYFNRGFALDQLGHKSAAIEDYSAALEHDPALVAAYQNRGVAQLELRQFDAAITDFDRLLELGRRGPVEQALRGQALEGRGRHLEADAAFAESLAHQDAVPELVRHRIDCAYGFAVCTRLPEQAERAFVRVPPQDPKYPEALYGRGLLAAHRDQPDAAIRFLGEALELQPGLEEARRFRAVLLARLGRFEDAVADINTALRANPQSGPVLYAAACVTSLAAKRATSEIAARQAADDSVDFLRRALKHGYGHQAAADPDLAAIRELPETRRLLDAAK